MSIRKNERVKKLREALVRRRRELVGELERIASRTPQGRPFTRSGDIVDRAHSDVWLEELSMLAESEERELAEIDEALQMMEEGDYGLCQRCGRSIPVVRLRAIPTAAYCVRCRAEADRSSVARPRTIRGAMSAVNEDESSETGPGRRRGEALEDLIDEGPGGFTLGN